MSVRVQGRLTTSVNQAAVAAAVAGLGILAMGFGTAVRSSQVARWSVLPDWQLKPIELHAVFAAGRAAKPSLAPSPTIWRAR